MPSKISKFNKRCIQDAWIASDTRHRENEADFLKYILAISFALLCLSVAVVLFISSKYVIVEISKSYLSIAWLSSIVTILMSIFSLLISKKANEVYLNNCDCQLNDTPPHPNYYNTACFIIEWVLFALFSICITINVSFIFYYL